MIFTAPFDLIQSIKTAVTETSYTQPKPRLGWARGVIENEWITLTELSDAIELEDSRFYPLSGKIEEICQVFELPVQRVAFKPQSALSESILFMSLSVVDAAALFIYLECVGFIVSPSSLAEKLRDKLESKNRLSKSELDVLFYSKHVKRRKTIVVTQTPPLLGPAEIFSIQGGYCLNWIAGEGVARLEVTGSQYKQPRQLISTQCPYCKLTYLKGSHDDAVNHRRHHNRHRHSNDPSPLKEFSKHLKMSVDADKVTCDSPKWANDEMYERAVMLKREMGYDFTLWTKPSDDGFSCEEGTGYLLVNKNQPSTIAGACAFRQHPAGWTLYWVWLAPKFRRLGILNRYWDRFVREYGDFDIEPPVSKAMQSFVIKNGTTAQKAKMQQYIERC